MKRLKELLRYFWLHVRATRYYIRRHSALPMAGTPVAGSPVIVSFTTTPGRIARIRPMLHSLLDQSVRPDRICLYLPVRDKKGAPYEIPDFIRENPYVKVVRTETDLGPATKSLPAISRERKDTLIIVVDDDQVYPKDLVANYLVCSARYPDSALCLCGWKVPRDYNHLNRVQVKGASFRIFDPAKGVQESRAVDIMQGASSYAIRPAFFDEGICRYEQAPEEAFYVDDVWISGHLARRGVKRLVIPAPYAYARLEILSLRGAYGLIQTVNRSGANNNVLYRYFAGDW